MRIAPVVCPSVASVYRWFTAPAAAAVVAAACLPAAASAGFGCGAGGGGFGPHLCYTCSAGGAGGGQPMPDDWSLDGGTPAARPAKGAAPSAAGPRGLRSAAARSFTGTAGPQVVLLDFDSDTQAGEFVYSAAQRDAVMAGMAEDYAGFNYTFTQTAPASGPFSTIRFNAGPAGGLADAIDFRNLDRNDNGTVNINGLGFDAPVDFVNASITIGSHELGHLAGLRHADSFGPIGSGIGPNVPGGAFFPGYTGPRGAVEVDTNLMSSPGSVGSDPIGAIEDTSFSARSAVRLAFNEHGTVTAEQAGVHDSIATAQNLTLPTFAVPNTARAGNALFGLELSADAEVVTGSLSVAGETDFYAFEADAGDLLNFEVISGVLDRNSAPFDTTISLFDAAGNAVDYFGLPAFNDDELEALDSTLIDLVIAEAGTYFVSVGSFANAGFGDYELYAYRFNVIPEPTTAAVLAGGLAWVGRRRRRA